jgi:hypothetical protein
LTELLTIARRLYERRHSGIVVPYKMVDSRHTEGDCHQNAGWWARDNAGCEVIHGWLVFDHEKASGGLISMVQFNPHSIIQTENGERYDVTPSRASTRYPFLDHEGAHDDFVRIVESNSLSVITYNPSSDSLI